MIFSLFCSWLSSASQSFLRRVKEWILRSSLQPRSANSKRSKRKPLLVRQSSAFFSIMPTGIQSHWEKVCDPTLSPLLLNPGLSHIIETRKVLDLRIDLKPSYLLLPKSGFYDGKSELMIVDFGYLQVSEERKTYLRWDTAGKK